MCWPSSYRKQHSSEGYNTAGYLCKSGIPSFLNVECVLPVLPGFNTAAASPKASLMHQLHIDDTVFSNAEITSFQGFAGCDRFWHLTIFLKPFFIPYSVYLRWQWRQHWRLYLDVRRGQKEGQPENHQYMLILSFLWTITPLICEKVTPESTGPFSPHLHKQPCHITCQHLSVLIDKWC